MENRKDTRPLDKAKIKLCHESLDILALATLSNNYIESAKKKMIPYKTASGQTIMVIPAQVSVRN